MQLGKGGKRGMDICGTLPVSGLLKSRFVSKLHSMEIYTKIHIHIESKNTFTKAGNNAHFKMHIYLY